jgi:GH24 family phage-related lysozyme (muramidase)
MNNVDHMKQMIQLMESAVATADDNEALIPDQEWEAWANSYVQRAKAVLPKDRVLNPKNKQTLATVIQKVEQKTQTKSTDMPLWGRVLFITTGLMMIVNKVSAAAGTIGVALADKDGDGDIDVDDLNDLMPEQINKYQEIHTQAKEFVKSSEFKSLPFQDQQNIVDYIETIDDELNDNIAFHTIDNDTERQDFDSNSETLDFILIANHISEKEAVSFDAERTKLAHELYGDSIDRVKSSDDRLSIYKMYDTDGNYRVYLDSLGKPTVGIGHLIDDSSPYKNLKVGDTITQEEGKRLFYADVADAIKGVQSAIEQHPKLQYVELEALVDVQFQMGNKVWNEFTDTMKLIDAGKYLEASEEAMNSQWAEQTPSRAKAFSDALKYAWKVMPNI